jgi:hypothetical protein
MLVFFSCIFVSNLIYQEFEMIMLKEASSNRQEVSFKAFLHQNF